MTQPPRSVFPTAASAVLLLALAAPVTAATVQTFSNPNAVTIVEQGNALPYPSEISVSGVPSNFTRLEVRLNLFSHAYPDDVDILLVGPQGQRTMLMSDAGGATNMTARNITFTRYLNAHHSPQRGSKNGSRTESPKSAGRNSATCTRPPQSRFNTSQLRCLAAMPREFLAAQPSDHDGCPLLPWLPVFG